MNHRLWKSCTFRVDLVLLTVFIVLSIGHTAGAQMAPSQPAATPLQTNGPGTPGFIPGSGHPPTIAEMSKPEVNMDEPRKIAAAIVAADKPAPNYVVSVGANVGAFLAVFMDKFPNARGQWTEPVDKIAAAKEIYLGKYGDRINYKIGCGSRDITDGCVPKDADVIITDWVSSHQPLDGIYKIFRAAYAQLPSGGWIVDIDRVSFGGSYWDPLLKTAVTGFRPAHEGPPFEHPADRTPTRDEQLGALRAAGFEDPETPWCSFTTCLFMARKK